MVEGGREGKGNIFLSGWGCAGSVGEGGAGWCCLAMGQGLHPMQLVSRWVLSGGFSHALKIIPAVGGWDYL